MSGLNCSECGRFFRMQPGVAWKMVYGGFPLQPHGEIYRCVKCVEKHGEFSPQYGIRPEYSCGIIAAPLPETNPNVR